MNRAKTQVLASLIALAFATNAETIAWFPFAADVGTRTSADVPLENKTSLQGLYHTCRSAYLIELGEYDQTARELEILRNVILSCGENRALADNLNTTLKIREAELNILKGEPVPDREWLNKLISRSTYNLRRLELYKTLADDAILRKDRTEALHRLRKMEEEGGKTRFADYAKAKRKEL